MIGLLKTGLGALPAVRLEGDRVYLRPPRPRDWKAWSMLRDQSREFLRPWEPTWPPDALSRGSFVRRLRRQIAEWRHDEGYGFLIFDKSNDRLIGGIGMSNVRRGVAQMASLGYWIGQCYAGNGYMTEAARIVISFAFHQLGLHRLEAVCLPNNQASQGLLERLGFSREGYARAYLRINGAWRDHVVYALLREDLREA